MLSSTRFSYKPMLCTSVERLPEGEQWRYELKLDGYRAIGGRLGQTARLWSRNLKDFARRFSTVTASLEHLPSDTVIDGEIVALDEAGKPSFHLLQGFGQHTEPIVFYAFDVLMYRGKDIRSTSLEDRRARLRQIVGSLPERIRYSETFDAPLAELISTVREHELEGIVAKRARSQYRCGERNGDWLKWRANHGQEFVIGGYMPNAEPVDSLLVGYYEGSALKFAGSVRAGLTVGLKRLLTTHFKKLRVAECPFSNLPDEGSGRWGEGLTEAKMSFANG